MRIAPSTAGAAAGLVRGSSEPERGVAARRLARHRLLGAPDRDARSVLLDRDLGDPGVLDDAHDLADPLRSRLVDFPAEQRVVAARAVPDRLQERLGLLAEEREQEQLLFARGEPGRVVPDRVEVGRRLLWRGRLGDERDGTLDGRVDLARRRAEAAVEQGAQLVDDRLIARRREDVDDRLRGQDLSDRSGDGRRIRPPCR